MYIICVWHKETKISFLPSFISFTFYYIATLCCALSDFCFHYWSFQISFWFSFVYFHFFPVYFFEFWFHFVSHYSFPSFTIAFFIFVTVTYLLLSRSNVCENNLDRFSFWQLTQFNGRIICCHSPVYIVDAWSMAKTSCDIALLWWHNEENKRF